MGNPGGGVGRRLGEKGAEEKCREGHGGVGWKNTERMYDTSTNSDCSCVRLLRPDTCHGPVMPGFTSNLAEYSVP